MNLTMKKEVLMLKLTLKIKHIKVNILIKNLKKLKNYKKDKYIGIYYNVI